MKKAGKKMLYPEVLILLLLLAKAATHPVLFLFHIIVKEKRDIIVSLFYIFLFMQFHSLLTTLLSDAAPCGTGNRTVQT